MSPKHYYVGAMRSLRRGADRCGALAALERRRDKRWALWLRSLLAIYDLEDLLALGLPWWTFDSIDLAGRFLSLHPGSRVFEYGSGASTRWLAQRAGEVHSLEHDEHWMQQLQPHLSGLGNVRTTVVSPQQSADPRCPSGRRGYEGKDFHDYVHAIDRHDEPFNLIVVDGRARGACLTAAVHKLASPGLIIFDNARRRRYRRAIDAVALPAVSTRGLTPCLPYPEATLAIFSDEATRDRVIGQQP